MTEAQQTTIVETLIIQMFHNSNNFISDRVSNIQNTLYQMGIWEEYKDMLKQFILQYVGYLGDAEVEYRNGLKKKKTA